MAAASSSSAAIPQDPQPPYGKTGILRPGLSYRDQQMKRGQRSFESAVDDMFAYLGKEDEQTVPDHRKINLVNPTGYSPLTAVGNLLEIVTSAQAPKRSEIGEQGIPMRVQLADDEYYWAKITTVDSRVGKEGKYALASFREVMVNLSLFGSVVQGDMVNLSLFESGVQGVAPMYNWFFTSVDPPSEGFIDQFAPTWHSLVFSTFYAPGMKEDFRVYFETMRAKLKENKEEIAKLSDKETKIKEKLAMPEKDAKMLQFLKDTYQYYFKKKWYHSAMVKSKRALVLISKSAGAIDLNRAYGEQGYGFPLERFLGTWPDTSPKRHGIVLFVRPFAALMAHILGILREMETNGFVHGDFHPGNLIAVPSFSNVKTAVPPKTTVWTWRGVYDDKSSGKNRVEMNNDKTLQFSNLPLYAPVAAQSPIFQLSYPSNAKYPLINGVNPGQYLQFRAIDLGFGYQVLEKMEQTFGITSKPKEKEVLKRMWTADKEISVFPSVFHPWFDKFRLGLYLAKSVLYSAKLATTGFFDKETQKLLPVIDFSK